MGTLLRNGGGPEAGAVAGGLLRSHGDRVGGDAAVM